ncbi:MAG: hypothetical protein BWX80_02435 [Candidatus Hydrogenedentes bacterium ADurb.Bin101]|nr:MAG: hypothetical protein BWX80_02435 [Candidatus Hydrogenedentes bacterium ADurb.Bin101]
MRRLHVAQGFIGKAQPQERLHRSGPGLGNLPPEPRQRRRHVLPGHAGLHEISGGLRLRMCQQDGPALFQEHRPVSLLGHHVKDIQQKAGVLFEPQRAQGRQGPLQRLHRPAFHKTPRQGAQQGCGKGLLPRRVLQGLQNDLGRGIIVSEFHQGLGNVEPLHGMLVHQQRGGIQQHRLPFPAETHRRVRHVQRGNGFIVRPKRIQRVGPQGDAVVRSGQQPLGQRQRRMGKKREMRDIGDLIQSPEPARMRFRQRNPQEAVAHGAAVQGHLQLIYGEEIKDRTRRRFGEMHPYQLGKVVHGNRRCIQQHQPPRVRIRRKLQREVPRLRMPGGIPVLHVRRTKDGGEDGAQRLHIRIRDERRRRRRSRSLRNLQRKAFPFDLRMPVERNRPPLRGQNGFENGHHPVPLVEAQPIQRQQHHRGSRHREQDRPLHGDPPRDTLPGEALAQPQHAHNQTMQQKAQYPQRHKGQVKGMAELALQAHITARVQDEEKQPKSERQAVPADKQQGRHGISRPVPVQMMLQRFMIRFKPVLPGGTRNMPEGHTVRIPQGAQQCAVTPRQQVPGKTEGHIQQELTARRLRSRTVKSEVGVRPRIHAAIIILQHGEGVIVAAGSQRFIRARLQAEGGEALHGKSLHERMVGLSASFHPAQHGMPRRKKRGQQQHRRQQAPPQEGAFISENGHRNDDACGKNKYQRILAESHGDTVDQAQQHRDARQRLHPKTILD